MGSLTAADGDDNFNAVAGLDNDGGMLAPGHDLPVAFHRDALARHPTRFEQGRDGHRLGQFGSFAIDVQGNHDSDFSIARMLPSG